MKYLFILTSFFLSSLCFANMASPLQGGTFSSSAFSSKDVDIKSESIILKIDPYFKTGHFTIEYRIQSDVIGKQIPLLFYAMDYDNQFKIFLDNMEIREFSLNKFDGFLTNPYVDAINIDPSTIHDSLLSSFELDLTNTTHLIRVEYQAEAISDLHDWITHYQFYYSLEPAKYWRSFGDLDITVEISSLKYSIETNLGEPTQRNQNQFSWHFPQLPIDTFIITIIPDVSLIAKMLLCGFR